MNIEELERRLRCLQCEAAHQKVHECDHRYAGVACQQHIALAHWELIKVWEPNIRQL